MLPLRSVRTLIQFNLASPKVHRLVSPPCWPLLQCHLSRSAVVQVEKRHGGIDDQLEVNYFEQDEGSTGGRRRIRPGEEEQEDDIASLKARIASLEEEISSFKLPREAPESLAASLFSKLQREQSTENFADDLAEFGFMAHQIKSTEPLSRTAQIYMDKLNECMDTASLTPESESIRKALWKWYERSKSNIPHLLSIIPKAGWDLLWQTQAVEGPSNPDRASHLGVLTGDMLKAGLELSKEQRYCQIESLYLTGHVVEALELWEKHRIDEATASADHLEMGIRMYANQHNLQKADELLEKLLRSSVSWDPRIVHSVIAAYLQSGLADGPQRAWALYLRMRDLLGTEMTIEDYDIITLGFLRSKSRDLALAVFRDMMLSGDASAAQASTTVYKKALTRMGQFFSLTKDAEELNTVSLDALTYLPRRYQNKFFYASWLKRLIGIGQLDAAAQVIELMYERGAAPDAKHMNGLISAWLREGSSHARRQAESLAWSMIQRRIDFVHARRSRKTPTSTKKKPSVYITRPDLVMPAFLERPVPFATSETFSIMVAHYLRQEMFENVRHLRDMIADCEIPISSYFMNHLLYAELRNRGYRHVWARFEVMSRTVKPDVETFICLWECMKFHADTTRNTDRTGFPTPEQLFAVMVQWYTGLRGQERSDAIGDLDLDTYHDVIRCFCLAGSLEGAFVVMHSIKEFFHLYPTKKTVRMLIMQIARINASKLGKAVKARGNRSKEAIEASLVRTTEILEILTDQRHSQLEDNGVYYADLDATERSEDLHRSLLMLLHTMASRQKGSDATDAAIVTTTAQLCVAPFDPQNAMALVV